MEVLAPSQLPTTSFLEVATAKKPKINLGELNQVKAAYLRFRSLGFTREAIESHLCGMLLINKSLVEEVEAVLANTASHPELSANLTVCQ